ncbi:MAG: YitT family protein [Desulfosarcinaceae bacterium]
MNHTRQPAIAIAVPPPLILSMSRASAQFARVLTNLALLAGGSLLWVLALQCFMVPHHILSGGLLGIAMICGHFIPGIDVAWLNLFLNLPLFWLGWRCGGMAFTLYSLFGTLAFSLLAGLVSLPFIVEVSPLWACLGAGLLGGGGSAMILRSAGTAGGLDILIVYLRNRFHWRVGRLVMAMNGAILLAGGHRRPPQ